jgi:hypothetical protein
MAALPMSRTDRIEGVDVARGVASLVMIQGHAYDGWVSPESKETAAYAFTRLLGTLPLPAFLVLAGAAVVLRVEAAARRGESATEVRRSVMRRGLFVLAIAYVVSAIYALIDGLEGIETILRADVLHVIGLSIAAYAFLGIRSPSGRAPDRRFSIGAALVLAIVPALLCPWLSPLGAHVHGPARFFVALFVDVPGVTMMPFIPLVSWVAIGALAAHAMLRADAGVLRREGAPKPFLIALAVASLAIAVAASYATDAVLGAMGGSLTRAHPAVWLNVIDLAARGCLVLAVAALASAWMPERMRRALGRLGRGSLLAYVLHIPFAYGALGEAVRGRLDMIEASLAVLALMLFCWLAVYARDALRDRMLAPSHARS